MGVDILRVESNERVDIADFEFISESVQAHERQMVDNFFCDPARTRKWVVSGFDMTNPATKQLQVTKGKAILGARLESNIEYGMLTTEGDATLTVDLNSYSPGTYGVYIRFEQIAGDAQSRIFWNPSGSGSEYGQSINTRLTAAWSLRVESTSPGSDWLKIGEVDQATMDITDHREFYFEGDAEGLVDLAATYTWAGSNTVLSADTSEVSVGDFIALKSDGWFFEINSVNPGVSVSILNPLSRDIPTGATASAKANAQPFTSGWGPNYGGGVNDRNWERSAYGVTDFQMAFAAMRQGLEDIKGRGLRRWWDDEIGGMNIGFSGDPVEDRLAVGNQSFALFYNDGDPQIRFDVNDHLQFTRSTSLLEMILGGVTITQWDSSSFYPGGAADSVNLGTAGQTWATGHITTLFPGTADGEGCNGTFKPSADGTHDLGSVTREWRSGYFDGTVYTDGLSLSTDTGEGLLTHLFPDSDLARNLGDSTEGLGSGAANRRIGRIYARSLQIQDGTTNLVHYAENGPADEKFYRWQADNAGTISLDFLDDSYLNPTAALVFSRTGEVPLSMSTTCRFTATYDSGYATAPYAPAVRLGGTNPYLHFDDADTGINAAHRDWGFIAHQGTGDAAVFKGLLLDTAGTTEYAWLQVETPTGANTRADYVYLNAYEQITLSAGPGTNNVVAISADGGTGPASSGDLGLTSDWFLGAAGAAFSIVGVSGATPRTSTGFLKIFANGTDRYVPFFDNYNG